MSHLFLKHSLKLILAFIFCMYLLPGVSLGSDITEENLVQQYPHYNYNTPDAKGSLYKISECIIHNRGTEPIDIILKWKDGKGGSFEKNVTISDAEETPEGDIKGGVFTTASLENDFPRVTQENIDSITPPGTLTGTVFSLYIYVENNDDKALLECSLIDITYVVDIDEEDDEEGETPDETPPAETPGTSNNPPTATIQSIIPNPAEIDQAVTFKATVSDPDGDSDINYLTWDFGDATSIVGGLDYTASTHTYNIQGLYNVTLTAADKSGAESKDTGVIEVKVAQPAIGQNQSYSEASSSILTSNSKPDLVITLDGKRKDIRIETPSGLPRIKLGETVTIRTGVTNIGNGPAGTSTLGFYAARLALQSKFSYKLIGSQITDPLLNGTSEWFSGVIDWTPESKGLYFIHAKADCNNEVAEKSEVNNYSNIIRLIVAGEKIYDPD